MKNVTILLFLLSFFSVHAQVTLSPEAFLGYKIGTKFSRHHQIESYFEYVAKLNPSVVKLEPYGNTPEGRPLFIAIVSSPKNLTNLASIQSNNLGMVNGTSSNEQQPTIVWLSYNVHGNEPASSEAAMLTLYELVNPQNSRSKEWLENTIVIIDPCLNPDGRDHYVNWYNATVGIQSNTDPQAFEHHEPSPTGRTNHYHFDLNRDWAWQTQVESQQRAIIYQKWYPQVHVDFHEQGCDEPYYFAPAANPIHTAVTPWQRSFQDKVGKNNARYFDANEWLYFTKERFDLLYPSYGDTYPMYNGAIGMTYEQGGIGGGLGIQDKTNSVLSLEDRVNHHLTTSLSTIEVSSNHAAALVHAFHDYYLESKKGTFASYQTYLLTAKTAIELKGITDLLDKNNILYGTFSGKATKCYNYQTGKETDFISEGVTIGVSMHQPHSVLANVLLEPTTFLADSNTYDITAWSIPFAYGIHAYASKISLPLSETKSDTTVVFPTTNFGYILPYQSFQSTKILSQLLIDSVSVRYSELAFSTEAGSFPAGTLLILPTANHAKWKEKTEFICRTNGISPIPLHSGLMTTGPDAGSPSVKLLSKAPRVACLTGESVSSLASGEVWNYFDNQLHYPLTLLSSSEALFQDWSNYDVVILPDGNFIHTELSEKLHQFVREGGTVIALEGSTKQLAEQSIWGLKMKELERKDSISIQSLPAYGNMERDYLRYSIPGAIYQLTIDATHPLTFGLQGSYYDLKQSTDLYLLSREQWNVGTIQATSYQTGFVGSEAKKHLTEGVIFGEKQIGKGSFIFLADDPLFRNFWESGLHLFGNAVFFHGR